MKCQTQIQHKSVIEQKTLQLLTLLAIMLYGCNKENDLSPYAITTEASEITQTSATISGVVNAKGILTFVSFDFGTTTEYGQSIAPANYQVEENTDTNISVILSGLTQNTTYHFRIFATNTEGETYGADQTFKTLERPTWLIAGETGSSVSVSDIIPDTMIYAGWNEDKSYYIDLDNDGNVNVSLRAYTVYTQGGLVLSQGGVKAYTFNSETFFASGSIYAFAYNEGDTIKTSDEWYSSECALLTYGNSSFPPGAYSYRGNWVEGENKYLGIKVNDLLGWIKVDVDKASYKLYEFALQK